MSRIFKAAARASTPSDRPVIDPDIETRIQRGTDQAIAYATDQVSQLSAVVDGRMQGLAESADAKAEADARLAELGAAITAVDTRLDGLTDGDAKRNMALEIERRVQLGTQLAIAFATARYDELAETNGKLLGHLPGLLNATATVPALAKLLQTYRRDLDTQGETIFSLEQQKDRLAAQLENATRSADQQSNGLTALQREVAGLREELSQIGTGAQFARAADLVELQAGLANIWQAIDRTNVEIASIWKSAEQSTREIGKIWQRIEFVRSEIMYEMKYARGQSAGGVSAPDHAERVPARIVNHTLIDGATAGSLKVNLGCGHVALPGYVNVDFRSLPDVDVVAGIDDLPFEANSVGEIFSSHVLEHLPEERLKRLLPYWRELLVEGGTFRAVVPDGEAMLAQHAAGTYPFADLRSVLFGDQEYEGDFHYNLFTPDSLVQLLQDAGFSKPIVVEKGRRNDNCYEFEIMAQA